MNEQNLDMKYVVLKIEDINARLDEIDRARFWYIVKQIIGEDKI